ncbi:alpha/beta hydrolase [Parasphingorhabdus sp. JC815]|uniref:alpha/beta hydrolase n=1 Tax=Parasphingorhabdus sp. JC815 TaxID=3232140 RepID=UPI0034596E25
MIDPHLQTILKAMADSGFQLPDPLEVPSLRAIADAPIPAPQIEIAQQRDLTIAIDGRELAGRLYHPEPSKLLPVVLFFHGGGWVHGTLETHNRLAAHIAVKAHCALISVDYRLAPENPFPAAWDDALLSLRWLKKHHGDLNIDAERIALAGDSAGGNLAAAAAQAVAGDAAIVHQLLFYPVLDGRCATASFAQDHPGFLSSDQMRWYWDQYAPAKKRSDPRASPAVVSISADLAPATIIVAGNDPLHDEGTAYAAALEAAGVATNLHDFPVAIHGFASLFGMAPIADEAIGKATDALRSAFRSKQDE